MLLVLGSTVAQQTQNQRIYQKIDDGIPQVILDAIEIGNPGFKFNKEHDEINKEKKRKSPHKMSSVEKNHYAVHTSSKYTGESSNKNSKKIKTVVYDANGSLVSSREIKKNTAVPIIVLRTMGQAYNGWLLVSTKTIMEETRGMRTVFYELVVENGKDREKIFFNEIGQIVDNRKMQDRNLDVMRENENRQIVKNKKF